MKIEFVKMHGTGNDFILIDCLKYTSMSGHPGHWWRDVSARLCDRRFGVGADQVLILEASPIADFRMRIFNTDGGEVEMCGNGIRCLAKYVWDSRYSGKKTLDIETLAGIIRPEAAGCTPDEAGSNTHDETGNTHDTINNTHGTADGICGDLVRVDMGEPILEGKDIPVEASGRIIDYPLLLENRDFAVTCVSMGNPHAVVFVDKVDRHPLQIYGPMIERHPFFPKRTNVEFVEVVNPSELKMRVWERGSGETLACGTGACAAAVASALKGLTGHSVTVHLRGGDLHVEWDTRVFMTGPAVTVFTGTVDLR